MEIANHAVTEEEYAAIPKKYSDMLWHNQNGYTYEAAAAAFGVATGTAKSRVSRAKEYLNKLRWRQVAA